jgi:uncharacterized protein (DUF1697 family)
MPTCIALLRGINVSGHNPVKMADLRGVVEALGHRDVETYLQSGNVVFNARSGAPSAIGAAIERRIAEDLGLDVIVLVRTKGELAKIAAVNPLAKRGIDPGHLYLTFLGERPAAALVSAIDSKRFVPDTFAFARREVYLCCPKGYGRTKLNNAFFERALATDATTRNWKTVNALLELAGR